MSGRARQCRAGRSSCALKSAHLDRERRRAASRRRTRPALARNSNRCQHDSSSDGVRCGPAPRSAEQPRARSCKPRLALPQPDKLSHQRATLPASRTRSQQTRRDRSRAAVAPRDRDSRSASDTDAIVQTVSELARAAHTKRRRCDRRPLADGETEAVVRAIRTAGRSRSGSTGAATGFATVALARPPVESRGRLCQLGRLA